MIRQVDVANDDEARATDKETVGEAQKRMMDKTEEFHNSFVDAYISVSKDGPKTEDGTIKSSGTNAECAILGACVFMGEVLASLSIDQRNYMYSRSLLGRALETIIGAEKMALHQVRMLAKIKPEGEA